MSHPTGRPVRCRKLRAMVDVLVVGAGPVGLCAALWAKRLGLSHLVLERGTVAETVYRFPRDMVFFSEAKNIEIGGHPLVAQGPKPTRKEALLYYQRVAEREGLSVLTYTEVLSIRGREGAFQVLAKDRKGERAFSARYVVVATGYFGNPNRLGVPGEDLPHVLHRYEEAAPSSGGRWRWWGVQLGGGGGLGPLPRRGEGHPRPPGKVGPALGEVLAPPRL